ncbi:MAG TPA: ABC transporter permease [Chthonomonadales bacterium]|nr:ABC transporter permease [Chthonomonadales bacterium]
MHPSTGPYGRPTTVRPPQGPWRVLDWLNRYRGLIALVVVFVLGCILSPRARDTGLPIFLEFRTQSDIVFEYCEYGLLAAGMTLVILTGGIDLSVSSVLGFCATLFALLTIAYGWPVPAAIACTIVAGLAAGAINGALVAWCRMQPFVATLAMMTAARGAAKWISGGIKVQAGGAPWYRLLDRSPLFFTWMTTSLPGIGLQPATLLFLLCIAALAIVARSTAYGRSIHAIGGNEEAARLCGIRVTRTKLFTYALCGAMAALAGVVNACRQDMGDPEAGFGFELDAIAAVVIGGTSMMGGRGGLGLTLVGVLIMGYINKILSLRAVDIAPRMVIQAAIIVAAVLIQRQRRGQ